MFHETKVDIAALRAYRLGRVREQLKRLDCMGALLTDPINIRYATDTTNMQVWAMHNAFRYCFVATDGPVILFDNYGKVHLEDGGYLVDAIQPATSWFYFTSGSLIEENAKAWAEEIADLVTTHGGGNRRLAIDKVNYLGTWALGELGVEIAHGEEVMEQARLIKSAVEIQAMQEAIDACEIGMARMKDALAPGVTETGLWSILHQANIEMGGEWIETRLLSSGPRTNPWYRECGPRQIEAGDMVGFDTDLVGRNGYCADISRSWVCGEKSPSGDQRSLIALAEDQVCHNMELLRPGVTSREISENLFYVPEEYRPNRYTSVYHGIGLCDEYPVLREREDWAGRTYDFVLEPGMTLCVESYMGKVNGYEGVKVEEQVLITDSNPISLSRFSLALQ